MSIKIYEAYRMDICSMTEFLKFCKEIQKQAEAIRLEMLQAMCKEAKKPYHEVFMEWQKRSWETKRTQKRDPFFDFSFEMAWFPIEDHILLILYCEHTELKKTISENSKIKFFGFWNNTDPDENCSDEEWKERERLWNKALLDASGIPSKEGFHFDILGYDLPIPKEIGGGR